MKLLNRMKRVSALVLAVVLSISMILIWGFVSFAESSGPIGIKVIGENISVKFGSDAYLDVPNSDEGFVKESTEDSNVKIKSKSGHTIYSIIVKRNNVISDLVDEYAVYDGTEYSIDLQDMNENVEILVETEENSNIAEIGCTINDDTKGQVFLNGIKSYDGKFNVVKESTDNKIILNPSSDCYVSKFSKIDGGNETKEVQSDYVINENNQAASKDSTGLVRSSEECNVEFAEIESKNKSTLGNEIYIDGSKLYYKEHGELDGCVLSTNSYDTVFDSNKKITQFYAHKSTDDNTLDFERTIVKYTGLTNSKYTPVADSAAPVVDMDSIQIEYKPGREGLFIRTPGKYTYRMNIADDKSGIKKVEWATNVDMTDASIAKVNKSGNRYSFTDFTFDVDTKYYVRVTDNVGNVSSVIPVSFEIDEDAPVVTAIKSGSNTLFGGTEGAKDNYVQNVKVENLTEIIPISVDATDGAGSGLSDVVKVEGVNGEAFEIVGGVSTSSTGFAFNIKPYNTVNGSYKGKLKVTIKDIVDNEAQNTTNRDKQIVFESRATHDSTSSVTIGQMPYMVGTETNILPVDVAVEDRYSGVKEIQYRLLKPEDDRNANNWRVASLQNEVVKTENENSDLITIKSGKLNLDVSSFDCNNIELQVKLIDNAGWETIQRKTFNRDITSPVMGIFNAPVIGDIINQSATVNFVISELNLNLDRFRTELSNTFGFLPTFISWTYNAFTNLYEAALVFEQEGDYSYLLEAFDIAGNKSNTVQGGFTIDKTAPQISVAYDNNESLNGKYFNRGRTATITVVERHFDPNKVVINSNATIDGSPIAFPGLSGWTSNGDVHTATLNFAGEGDYSYEIVVTDASGNVASHREDEFTIDMTAPTITITGVEDLSSNGKEVAPIITFNDYNIRQDGAQINLVGAKKGASSLGGGFADIHNGFTYSYGNFPEEKEIDDIYTLTANVTDLAGNTFEHHIQFSVNRFGSIYILDDNVKNINGKYTNEAIEVRFTEANVDSFVPGTSRLTMSVNGTPKTLEAGKDYSVTEAGGEAAWKEYTYVLPKELFSEDGTYIISSYSEDKAGNVNENTDESKEAIIEFAVDTTAPQVVLVNLDDDEVYDETEYEAKFSVTDNLMLDTVVAKVDDKEVEVATDGEEFTFDIPESTSRRTVTVEARDVAGNQKVMQAKDILVSTNVFVRFLSNTPLVIGASVGIIIVIGAVVGTVLFIRKRKMI